MDSIYQSFLIYWSIGAVFFLVEWLRPARRLDYRRVFLRDLVALGTYNVFFLTAVYVTDRIPMPDYVPWRFQALPFAVKLLCFALAVDCTAYWLHRLWHTAPLWRIHKWHHSPTYMYWLAGVRASLPQVIMAGLPFTLWLPLLKPVPALFFVLYSVFLIVTNNWMHMNVTWRSRWLEWVFVTPRYHHVHHGDQPSLYMRNFGVVFTFWDRLFGTYADPESVGKDIHFGIRETASPVRLAIGL
ncbi:MAG TPA: sterol desaturase family protein [Nitrospiraceae bacterium]|nr:sterol desaturase family protein [Nitrospiraceae bacterium]